MKYIERMLSLAWLVLLPLNMVEASSLSDAAQSLEPGQSIRLATELDGNMLSPPEDGSNFLQWASSGVWDSARQEVRFIGKRDGSSAPYRLLTYSVATNSWNIDRSVPIPVGAFGHGYDHNTGNSTTGEHYFRKFNSKEILRWNGTWSSLPEMPEASSVAASIAWFPGVGLVYADQGIIQYFDGNKWIEIESSPPDFGLHVASEYNEVANMIIIGGGNNAPRTVIRLNDRLAWTRGADAPFNIGSSASAAVLAGDPTSEAILAWSKAEKTWAEYDIAMDRWNMLTQSVGDGSTPQTGTPNLSDATVAQATIGIPITNLGVIMFVQFVGFGETPAAVWLYRHSSDNRVPRPLPPEIE